MHTMKRPARWSESVRDWLSASRTTRQRPESTRTIEQIKQLMLHTLDRSGSTRLTDDVRLRYRIKMCDDVLSLWYLRSDLMQVSSARFGELEANLQLDRISALFEGLLPAGLTSQQARRNKHSRPDARP